VTIARAALTLTYPASFMLVAAMNPCPCGYFSDPKHECRCTVRQIHKYRSKISGPLLDRIDIHVEVPAVSYRDLTAVSGAESSAAIGARVAAARALQAERFEKTRIYCNAQMGSRHLKRHCQLPPPAAALLEDAIDRLGLSARAYARVLKIARTVADLAGQGEIGPLHVAEAVQYRNLDRKRLIP
jgi:magnesium chelatase family protein